jgi:predicted MPP superfamily phosphohydrolase
MIIKDFLKLVKKFIIKIRKISSKEPSPADISRRNLLQTSGWILSGVPFALVSKGLVTTTHDYTVYDADIQLNNLGSEFDDFVIVQLSDLHAGSLSTKDHFLRVADITNRLNGDLIVITGDFVNFSPLEMPTLIPGLEKLAKQNRVMACLGNHDHYMEDSDHKELIKILRESGLELLINENRTITKGSDRLHIAGVDNANFRTNYADFPIALAGLDDGNPKVLLCHDPTNWDKTVRGKLGADLMLAGHTHGGQVGIDVFGQFLSPVRIVYKQWAGLYKESNEYLYINRGIGVVGPPLRVDMPPEITKITLKRINS